MRKPAAPPVILLFAFGAGACAPDVPSPTGVDEAASLAERRKAPALASKRTASVFEQFLATANAALAAEGSAYRALLVEYLTSGENGEIGREVVFRDVGNKHLTFGPGFPEADFVPGDTRRGWNAPDFTPITYAVDQVDPEAVGGLSIAATTAAIDRAMATWGSQSCSTGLSIVRNPDFGLDIGVLAFQVFGGAPGLGGPFVFADVQHAGWELGFAVPSTTIGFTATFAFIDGMGNLTDVDGNGKIDVAFREIYYNETLEFGINTILPFDVETIAAHEAGHGLSQAHFGQAFFTDFRGGLKVHFAPRALMNAAYSGIQQELSGTDSAGHCSLWGDWPIN